MKTAGKNVHPELDKKVLDSALSSIREQAGPVYGRLDCDMMFLLHSQVGVETWGRTWMQIVKQTHGR